MHACDFQPVPVACVAADLSLTVAKASEYFRCVEASVALVEVVCGTIAVAVAAAVVVGGGSISISISSSSM